LPDLQGFFGDRLIGKYADPELASTLHITRNSTACSFQLPGRQVTSGHCLESELAETHLVSSARQSAITALLLLSVLGLLRLQHRHTLKLSIKHWRQLLALPLPVNSY